MKQMANTENLDLAWMRWADVMRDASSLMGKRDFAAALAAVESFLAREAWSDLRSDALGFKADLQERLGDLEAAKEDLLTARSLVGATYARYVHELSLGAICRKQNRVAESASWFRTALHTCLEGEGISGGTALKELFALTARGPFRPKINRYVPRLLEAHGMCWDCRGSRTSRTCQGSFQRSRREKLSHQERGRADKLARTATLPIRFSIPDSFPDSSAFVRSDLAPICTLPALC